MAYSSIMHRLIIIFLLFTLPFCSKATSDINLVQAKKHFEQKEYEEALAFYEEAIRNKEDYKSENKNIAKALYTLGKQYYEKNNYSKALLYLDRLLTLYPTTPYRTKALEITDKATTGNIAFLFKNKKYHETLKVIKEYKYRGDENNKALKEIIAKATYYIALEHYNKKEYFLAREIIKKVRPLHDELDKDKDALEEKILFYDGSLQFEIKAYKNAKQALKELLIKYPKSKYKKRAETYIRQIDKEQAYGALDNKNPSSSLQEELLDKGNKENPYNEKDLLTLIKYMSEEKLKNKANLKQNIFPIYEGKYIKLENIGIEDYKENKNKGLLNRKTRSLLDRLINTKVGNEASSYKYMLQIRQIKQVKLLLKEKDFLKLDFRKPIKPIDFLAQTLTFTLEKKRLKITLIPLNISQKE